MEMQAISVQAGAPRLVARTIAVETGAKAKEHVQDPKIVSNIIKKGEQDFPEGALTDVNEDADTKMNAWNAYLQVNK